MEEGSSNGKIEETQKVELLMEEKIEDTQKLEPQGEDEELVIEAVEAFKTDDDSVKASVVDENSELVNEAVNLEKLEEEKEFIESVVDPVKSDVSFYELLTQVAETPVENSEASDVTEYESKENGEKILPSSDEINGFSPVVTDVVSKGIEETILPVSDENVGQSSGIVDSTGKENVDNMIQTDENIVDFASKGNVETLLQQPADVPSVETSNDDEQTNESEIPESIGTKPIISLTPRILQPTSWRCCCGLFDVLRRSSR